MSIVLTETIHTGAFIVSEDADSPFYSRDQITCDATNALLSGTVLGKQGIPANEAASVAAAAGNVGNGTFTLDATAPVAAAAIDGIYEIILRSAGATGGFEVIDPKGIVVGEGAVGTTFNGPIKFLLADGATHFAMGDRFLVTVARPDLAADKYGPIDLTQSNGLQIASAILIYPVEAVGGTVQVAGLMRHAEVRLADLTWPAGITNAQKAEAVNQLRARGIIPR
jgi:hypothetical protein